MSSNTLLTDIDARGVGTITLNRPERHNAFDENLIQELLQTLITLADDPNVRIVVLKGQGKNFCAGADLNWMRQMAHYSDEENFNDAYTLGQLMYELYHFKKPTLAIVQGATYGGGVGLVACCQIAIAAHDATFCFSEVKLGLIPSVISPYIVNAMGYRQASAYFLTGQIFDAQTALQTGLCQQVVPADQLQQVQGSLIAQLLQNGPNALQAIHRLMQEFQPIRITPQLQKMTAQLIAQLRRSAEGQEGLSAFLQKRKPSWSRP